MTEMTKEDRARYDARAEHEAWAFAHEVMEPWMEITRLIGSDELARVMERAFAEVDKEVGRTLDVLEDLDEGVGVSRRGTPPAGSYRAVLEKISRHHGFSGAEEVARKAAELDPRYRAEDLLERPAYGYGTALDAVLGMDEAERYRLTRAFSRSFLSPEASDVPCSKAGVHPRDDR
jgi:hypothetical protein